MGGVGAGGQEVQRFVQAAAVRLQAQRLRPFLQPQVDVDAPGAGVRVGGFQLVDGQALHALEGTEAAEVHIPVHLRLQLGQDGLLLNALHVPRQVDGGA